MIDNEDIEKQNSESASQEEKAVDQVGDAASEQNPEVTPAVEPNNPFLWYVIRAISGKEKKVKQYLDVELQRSGFESLVKQVVIPMEKVVQVRNGKKVIKERNMMPGYILMEANLNAEVISMVAQVPNIIHFLGRENPEPIRQSEVNKILGKVDEMADAGESLQVPYIIGESVKVVDGPFNDFSGVVEEIMEEKKKLKVMVKIFGRRTPLELNYMQVEKIS